ncbi:MAG TPA: HD domain-containing phosphohydrolase [Holophaga sp.]|nr:HD domain-containing phosphohydrolase [Holophaga sp.]
MAPKILIVDDDESVLSGFQRTLRKRFEIDVATQGERALQILAAGAPYAVVVADMHMPGMNGLDLLMRVRDLSPDTSRIMLTGDADQRTAVDAVNHGQVFRFLAKPCEAEALAEALEAGARQHQLVRAEKELLEKTLSGAVEAMTELLSSVDPVAFGVAQLLKYRAIRVARILKAEREWEIGLAALLSPIGRLTLASSLLQRYRAGVELSRDERGLLERVPEFGARMLRRIPRLEGVADLVLYQDKGFDGSGFPENGPRGLELPFGARILKPLADVIRDEQEQDLGRGLDRLFGNQHRYDPDVFLVVKDFLEAEMGLNSIYRNQGVPTRLDQLREGQILASRVVTEEGTLVLLPGIQLSSAHLQLRATWRS